MANRASFLDNPIHEIVFHYKLKHAFWMNQVEIWFSILFRKLLKRASFISKEDLKARLFTPIDYFNRTMDKPFKGLILLNRFLSSGRRIYAHVYW